MKWHPRIYLVEDDAVARRVYLPWLEQISEAVVEMYASAEEFLAAFKPGEAGVLVLDNRMLGMWGQQLVEQFVPDPVDIPILMISANADVPLAVKVVKKGVRDIMIKPVPGDVLVERVKEILSIERQNWPKRAEATELKRGLKSLTPRETEVLAELVCGRTNKDVALILGISPKTVEIHRGRVLAKLQADSVTELLRRMTLLGVEPFAAPPP